MLQHAPQGGIERHWSALLTTALQGAIMLDRYANAVIAVFVTVLEDDGGCWGALTTAASAALADAGIHMHDIVVGCEVVRVLLCVSSSIHTHTMAHYLSVICQPLLMFKGLDVLHPQLLFAPCSLFTLNLLPGSHGHRTAARPCRR